MRTPALFDRDERVAIAEMRRSGARPACPRCGAPLDEWPSPPRQDVAYVRDRIWLVCTPCFRSVVLDRHQALP